MFFLLNNHIIFYYLVLFNILIEKYAVLNFLRNAILIAISGYLNKIKLHKMFKL
ncbi:hypothetical protein NUSPORA_00236 [Nucleospora cyclopteri]